MLVLDQVHAHYGSAHVLQGVSLAIEPGQIACLIGRNGAGKSTTLKSIMGVVQPSGGTITFKGERIEGLPPHTIAARGLAWVPEDRRCFASLTVEENITVAAQTMPGPSAGRIAEALAFFPDLQTRMKQRAGSLSGGQQQMLTIARALAIKPDLIMLDEPTEGLSPMMVDVIRKGIVEARARGVSILLVEQNIRLALAVAELFYVINRGNVVYRGTREQVAANPQLISNLLGVGSAKPLATETGMNVPKTPSLAAANAAAGSVNNPASSINSVLTAAVSTQVGDRSVPTSDALRRVFGSFATGVSVIGARSAEGAFVGMTVNSFTSVSLNPPLVLFCASRSLTAFSVYASAPHFSVNMLSQDARSVSGSFARSGAEKWSTVAHTVGTTGVPLLTSALASLECEVVARHDAGDHIIVIGRVLRMRYAEGGDPLIFYASRYRRLEPRSAEEGDAGDDVSFLIWG